MILALWSGRRMHNKPSQTVIGIRVHHSYRHLNISLVCLSHNGLGLRILFCNIYVLIYEAFLQNDKMSDKQFQAREACFWSWISDSRQWSHTKPSTASSRCGQSSVTSQRSFITTTRTSLSWCLIWNTASWGKNIIL